MFLGDFSGAYFGQKKRRIFLKFGKEIKMEVVFLVLAVGSFVCGSLLLAVGVGVIFLIFQNNQTPRRKKMDVKVLQGATAKVVEMNTLEAMPFAGWKLEVQGQATVLVGNDLVVTGPIVDLMPEAATYINPAFGRVEMGKVPGAGYTQWSYREAKNGVVNPVYTIINNHLYFGGFQSKRFLTRKNGKVQKMMDFPSGFGDQGDKTLEDAFDRELAEEANLQGVLRVPMVTPEGEKLPGSIMNRAFFADDDDQNTQMYRAVSVDHSTLKANTDGTFTIDVEYTPDEPAKDDKTPEANLKRKIVGAAKQLVSVTFYRWEDMGLWCRDAILGFACLRVLAMYEKGWLPEQKNVSAVDHNTIVGVDA